MKSFEFFDVADDSSCSIEGETQEILETEIRGVLESQSREILELAVALKNIVRLCDKDLLLDPEVWNEEEIDAYREAQRLSAGVEVIDADAQQIQESSE